MCQTLIEIEHTGTIMSKLIRHVSCLIDCLLVFGFDKEKKHTLKTVLFLIEPCAKKQVMCYSFQGILTFLIDGWHMSFRNGVNYE